jgi:DNA-directed RNA polymerase subunit M/transcription elongation factor TFIIS
VSGGILTYSRLRPNDQLRDREKDNKTIIEKKKKKAKLILLETGRLPNCGTEYENHHPKHHRSSLVNQIQKQEELKKISEQTPVLLNLASYKTA